LPLGALISADYPYEGRLNQLGLWSLQEHRNIAELMEIFKMVKKFYFNFFDILLLQIGTDPKTR